MKRPSQTRRRLLGGAAVAAVVATAALVTSMPMAAVAAGDACPDLTTSVTHLGRAGTGGDLLTTSASEAQSARGYGYTSTLTSFSVASSPGTGLSEVRRLYSPKTYDFTWAVSGTAAYSTATSEGYQDQGRNFYAAGSALSGCTQPAYSMVKNGVHRIALGGELSALTAAGWSSLGAVFHVAGTETTEPPVVNPPPPVTTPTGTTFSFAVMPDTQNEVGNNDQRMQKRVAWLLKNRAALDLRWVLHSGDLQSWDTADHYQYKNNSTRLTPLENAGLPFVGAIGNHDTGAVCPGGSACPGKSASVTVRDTTTWNSFYPPSRFGLEGLFEAGKSDNGYRIFQAGGLDWLVLDVELWPRPAVVTWAKNVVATHPKHNVILLTHAFLEADGSLSTSNGGYGATAPSALWAALDDYPNVVMTFSGHVGAATETNLTAADGHRTAAFLQALHAPDNPVRIVTVDVDKGTISSQIRVSYDPTRPAGQQDVDLVQSQYNASVTGMRWVR